MLTRLSVNQVSAAWEGLKEPIRRSLVPQLNASDEAMNNILAGLLKESSQAWILSGDDDSDKEMVYAVGITCFSMEMATADKNLLIYSLYGFKLIPDYLWARALTTLKDFARNNGCYRIIAFTLVDRIVHIAKSVGGNVDTRLIYWEV